MNYLNLQFKIANTRISNFFLILKKLKNYIHIFIIFIFLYSCSTFSDLIGKNELEINDFQIQKFKDYLNGKFYSNELKQLSAHNVPMIFAISKNGMSSLNISCYYNGEQCNIGVYGYQSLRKYSKKLGNDLYIFAIGKRIVWSGANLLIQKKIYQSDLKILKNEIVNNKIAKINNSIQQEKLNTYSLIMLPQDNCSSDDC